jgi:acyl-CoA thioesterase FadM
MTATDYIGTPVRRGSVLREWIDVNNHMNVAYYVLAFDLAVDSLWERFGITRDYINVTALRHHIATACLRRETNSPVHAHVSRQ